MKHLKKLLLFVLFLNVYQVGHAALNHFDAVDDSIRKPYYYAWIYTTDSKKVLKGYIRMTSDNAVFFSENLSGSDFEVSAEKIKKVAFRKVKQSSWIITGSIVGGIVLGALIGLIYGSYQDDNPEDALIKLNITPEKFNAFYFGLFGVLAGWVAGLWLAFRRKKIVINGDMGQFSKRRPIIQRYTLTGK